MYDQNKLPTNLSDRKTKGLPFHLVLELTAGRWLGRFTAQKLVFTRVIVHNPLFLNFVAPKVDNKICKNIGLVSGLLVIFSLFIK